MRQPVQFGKYILLDRISVGGMAEVFKAKSFGVEGFEKVIAIKRILPSMGEDKDFVGMFIDEAKIAGVLAHANICQIFELGKIDDAHFIAMELIWGKDLLQLQNRFRKLGKVMPPAMACYVIAKVCEGLDYAHRKRDPLGQPLDIVHRDCSPQNVLISYEGEVKLIDFGIAKAATRSSKTVAGVLKGKFGYMSPEQVRGLALDRRSDVFAVGTVLYECLTGERLFQCESDFTTLEKVRNVSIFPPSHFNESIPAELERIVMKALARNPDDRYQWANELQADLQSLLMKESKVFTAKAMGAAVKRAFAAEVQRERRLMERYKQIGPDGRVRSGAGASVAGAHQRAGSQAVADFDDDKPTEIFGELEVNDAEALEQEALDEPSREVLVSGEAAGKRARAASVPPPIPGSRPLSEEQTLSKGVPPVGGAAPAGGDAPLTLGTRRLGAQPRSSVVKDIGIGLGIAALVLASFAGAKYLFFDGQSVAGEAQANRTGTIAVTVPDLDPADVYLNGERAGRLEGGEAFTIESLPPGDYMVVVRRAGVPDCVRAVDLNAKNVEVVSCAFDRSRSRQARLTLRGAIDGATVFVDGAEISAESAREPLLLAPEVEHEIRVVHDGAPDQLFALRLAAGEAASRTVLPPSARPRAALRASARRVTRESRNTQRAPTSVATEQLQRARRIIERGADSADEAGGGDEVAEGEAADGSGRAGPPDQQRAAAQAGGEQAPEGAKDAKGTDAKGAEGNGTDENDDQDAEVGYLVAWTTPWARVWVDGEDTGKTTPIAPRAAIELSAGSHRVTFVVEDEEFSFPVEIAPGQTVRLREQLPVAER